MAYVGGEDSYLPIAVVSIYTNVRIQNLDSVGYLVSAGEARGGTLRPSTFAVLRLIVSRILVACSTGRSLGLAPRRILSMYSAPRVWVQHSSWP